MTRKSGNPYVKVEYNYEEGVAVFGVWDPIAEDWADKEQTYEVAVEDYEPETAKAASLYGFMKAAQDRSSEGTKGSPASKFTAMVANLEAIREGGFIQKRGPQVRWTPRDTEALAAMLSIQLGKEISSAQAHASLQALAPSDRKAYLDMIRASAEYQEAGKAKVIDLSSVLI